MRRLILALASNGGLGYAPVAPGTFGSLAGIPAYYLMGDLSPAGYAGIWTVLLAVSFWAAEQAGRIFGVADDGRIVIDELVGYLVAVAFLPFSWSSALLGFLLFRVFDVVKLPPAGWIDRNWKNGIGVVLDDVVAGLYSAAALRIFLAFL